MKSKGQVLTQRNASVNKILKQEGVKTMKNIINSQKSLFSAFLRGKGVKRNEDNDIELISEVQLHGGTVEQISDAELISDVEFHGGSVEQINDTELISDVEFHGGSVEQINDAELISDVEFHGGESEQINDAELISDVEFHNIYTVWACQNTRCAATFRSWHHRVCPLCGSQLAEEAASYEGRLA